MKKRVEWCWFDGLKQSETLGRCWWWFTAAGEMDLGGLGLNWCKIDTLKYFLGDCEGVHKI
jgi:hypothetical protein